MAIKTLFLSILLVLSPILNAEAQKHGNCKYIFIVSTAYQPLDCSLVPLDSIKHVIELQQIDYIFLPTNVLLGLEVGNWVLGMGNIPCDEMSPEKLYYGFGWDGADGDIEDHDGLQALATYVGEYNRSGRKRIQMRGYDLWGANGVYFASNLNDYSQTSIPDSVRCYMDALVYDADYDAAARIAVRTATMIDRNEDRLKAILKDEYEIWSKYVHEVMPYGIQLQQQEMSPESRDSLLLDGFQWMDKHHPGNKVVICSKSLGEILMNNN